VTAMMPILCQRGRLSMGAYIDAPHRNSIRVAGRRGAGRLPLRVSYRGMPFSLWISYARASHDRPMRSLSKDDARRIGAQLKRWSERPIGDTNARALGLCAVLAVMMLVAAQHTPKPADAIRTLAVMSAVMLASMHFMSLGVLRGLLRAGVAEAQDAMNAVRDPRRISAFDMSMTWLLVAGVARYVGGD
jgi:hypothetical protein